MAGQLDVLTLGPVEFIDFSPPEQMPAGGKQRTALHEILGGSRVLDLLGASPDDREWSGFWFGADALPNALTLDALKTAGQPLTLTWAAETRTVVITKFNYHVEKLNYVHYSICCMIADNNEATAGAPTSADNLASSDLSAATTTTATNTTTNQAIQPAAFGRAAGPV